MRKSFVVILLCTLVFVQNFSISTALAAKPEPGAVCGGPGKIEKFSSTFLICELKRNKLTWRLITKSETKDLLNPKPITPPKVSVNLENQVFLSCNPGKWRTPFKVMGFGWDIPGYELEDKRNPVQILDLENFEGNVRATCIVIISGPMGDINIPTSTLLPKKPFFTAVPEITEFLPAEFYTDSNKLSCEPGKFSGSEKVQTFWRMIDGEIDETETKFFPSKDSLPVVIANTAVATFSGEQFLAWRKKGLQCVSQAKTIFGDIESASKIWIVEEPLPITNVTIGWNIGTSSFNALPKVGDKWSCNPSVIFPRNSTSSMPLPSYIPTDFEWAWSSIKNPTESNLNVFSKSREFVFSPELIKKIPGKFIFCRLTVKNLHSSKVFLNLYDRITAPSTIRNFQANPEFNDNRLFYYGEEGWAECNFDFSSQSEDYQVEKVLVITRNSSGGMINIIGACVRDNLSNWKFYVTSKAIEQAQGAYVGIAVTLSDLSGTVVTYYSRAYFVP